jgi:hypothetical protein
MGRDLVLDWLLDPSQPGVRYRALTDLLGRPESEPDVREAREAVPQRGWAATILAERNSDGRWQDGKSLYVPKYGGTNWKLLVLAELGATKDDPRVRASAELWMERMQRPDGGFGPGEKAASHLCTTGNAARALVQFGYGEDPRVRRAMEWLVGSAASLGGWSCFGSGRSLDGWEPLAAFAVYPRSRWSPEMAGVVERGAEFFLSRELFRQGERYEPWFRTHSPAHYYYDLLVGLDALTALGYGGDPRLTVALAWLQRRRRRDGRWNLDAVHPDVEGGRAEWFARHPKHRPTPLALEVPGTPSKLVTLAARRVLARVAAAPATPGPATAPPETPRAASRGSTAGSVRRAPRPGRTTSRARRPRSGR